MPTLHGNNGTRILLTVPFEMKPNKTETMESKHTPGPWKIRFFHSEKFPDEGFFIEAKNNNMPQLGYGIEVMQEDFGDHNGYPTQQRLADAQLIAEAGTVATETGLSPRQLAEQRKELLEALKEIAGLNERGRMRSLAAIWAKAEKAISSATKHLTK